MKYIVEKRNYIIFFIIIVLIVRLMSMVKSRSVYVKSYSYGDEIITINIYNHIDEKKVNKDLKKIYASYEKNKILGYLTTDKVLEYFKTKKIDKYIINEGGNITVGKRYSRNKYKISIINPDNNKILKIVNLENESMATINNNYDVLTVISDDNIKANEIKEKISDVTITEGKKIAKENSVEAFWYEDGKISKTENFDKYIK